MLSLRSKITLLSIFSSLFVVIVLYVTIIYTYSTEVFLEIDRDLVKETRNVINLLKFDDNAKLVLDQKQIGVNNNSKLSSYGYIIRDKSLNILRRSLSMISYTLPDPDILHIKAQSYKTIDINQKKYRIYNSLFNQKTNFSRELYVIQLMVSFDYADTKISELNRILLWSIPIPLLLISLAAWWVATNALKPVKELVSTIESIDASDLRTRLSTNRTDEIGQISSAFNHMLNRIQNTFKSLTRFTADASHELRTPLTSLRTQAEVILSKKRSAEEYKDTLQNILEDLTRIERMISLLLELARSDAGLIQYELKKCNISELTEQWVDHFTALAEERKIEIKLDIEKVLFASIDRTLYERILINLIENAIEYSPENTRIQIRLDAKQKLFEFQIADQGLGISDDKKEKIFERFVRLDQTRHHFQGSGLGLAIVKWAVLAHKGVIQVKDNVPNGSIFIVTLPFESTDNG